MCQFQYASRSPLARKANWKSTQQSTEAVPAAELRTANRAAGPDTADDDLAFAGTHGRCCLASSGVVMAGGIRLARVASAWLNGQRPAGSCHARSVPSALTSRVIASRVVWSLTRSGSQAQAMQ